MTIEIKQSTAHTFLLGPFVDKDDGVTVETGLATAMDNASTGIRVSKNGGNMADRNDGTAPAHDEDGFYTIILDTTDTNTLGLLQVEYTEVATCLPGWQDFSVVTANYWDTKYSTDQFDVNITNIIGTAPTLTSTNIDVNIATQDNIDFGATQKASINTEVDSALDTAITELSQGVPSATPSLRNAVMLMYMALRNKLDVQTSGTDALEVHADDGTQIAIKLLTDSGGDYSEAKMTTGV